MPPKAAKAKVDDGGEIFDLMDVEYSESSNRQDSSARAKFIAFLQRIKHKRSFDQLRKLDVDKALVGKFCSFMLDDEAISWQTSMNYLISVRRQLEQIPGVRLFKDEPDWYRKCRRNLHNQYVIKCIAAGKPLKDQAPTMTFNDLVQLCTILFRKNTKSSLMDRTLLNNQWLAIGRSSDIGNLQYTDLHWQDHFLLIDLTRLKTRQQHSLSIFCSPCQWAVDPSHALACQLLSDPYDASQKVFSQIGEGQNETRIAAHINRVLRSTYDRDLGSNVTKGLQSHSARRGGAAHASSNSNVNLSDLAHRGLWSMDGFSTLLEYISPTSESDQRVAKVLSGWQDPKRAGVPPSLRAFGIDTSMQSRVNAFAQHMRSVFFTKLDHSGFSDCLTATLLMYLDDTLAVLHDHIVHSQLLKVAMLHGADVDELKHWGRWIRNRFVLDNLQLLPVETIQKNLDDRERAAQHVAVHTFAETLERCVVGYSELTRKVHELKAMVQVLIYSSRSQNDALARTGAHVAHTRVPSQEPDMLTLGRQWPDDFSSLREMKLQDLVVRYVRHDMATVAMDSNIRLHKEVMHAMAIVVQFADLSSIPPVPATISDSAVATYMNTLSAFARDVQLRVVAFIEQRRQLLQTGKRKRSINGSVSGVVKAWGKLPEIDRARRESASPLLDLHSCMVSKHHTDIRIFLGDDYATVMDWFDVTIT